MCARAFETPTDVRGKIRITRSNYQWYRLSGAEPLSQALRARLPSRVPPGQKSPSPNRFFKSQLEGFCAKKLMA
jgi:hypothetical protein